MLPPSIAPVRSWWSPVVMPAGLYVVVVQSRLDLHHAHPPHERLADLNIVAAHVTQLAVVRDAEDRQGRRHRHDCGAFAHFHRTDMRDHEQAAARVDVECPRMEALRVGVLYQRRLTGRLVDRENREAVLPAAEDA